MTFRAKGDRRDSPTWRAVKILRLYGPMTSYELERRLGERIPTGVFTNYSANVQTGRSPQVLKLNDKGRALSRRILEAEHREMRSAMDPNT